MRKITFSLAGLLISCLGFSQVSIVEDFPTAALPSGWTTDVGTVTTTQACASASFRANLYYDFDWGFGVDEGELVSSQQASNGADLVITFDYKIVNYSAATVPTDPFDGSITTQVSLDGGDTWTIDAGIIDSGTHTPGNACTTITYTVPGASVPAGSDVRVRWFLEYGTVGDYYIYLDNISAVQATSTVPPCTALTTPAEDAQNVLSPIITWTNPGGSPTGYKLTIGTTPTGTDILNNFDVGNVTTYNLNSLVPGVTYYVTIVPYNVFGDATGCTASTFTTCGALTVPHLEIFDVDNPDCWARGKGGDSTTGPTSFLEYNAWFADGFANNGTTGAVKANIYYNDKNDWLISPSIAIPTTGYELKFDAAAVEYAETIAPEIPWEADDFVQVLIQTAGSAVWEEVLLFNSQNVPPAAGSAYVVGLSAYSGQNIKVAFRAFEGTSNGSADIDFSIDNFEIREIPTTAPGCATNLIVNTDASCGNNPSEILWDPAVGADGYLVSIGTTSGGSDVINSLNIGSSTSYMFAGTVNTTYYVTVVPFNGAGNATACSSVQFATSTSGCYCPSAPTSVDGYGITAVVIENESYDNANGETYVDYIATPATVAQGGDVTVSMTFDTAGEGSFSYDYDTHIWVDYNNNYSFEASEIVYTGLAEAESPTVLTATFTVPAATAVGEYRMRIGAADSGQATANPCYDGTWGVTMDFVLVVDQAAGTASFAAGSLKVYPNPVKDMLALTNTSEITKVEVFNMVGQLVISKELNASEAQINMAGLTAGAYIVNITSEGVVKSVKLMKD
jgi:hypothetical protein